MVEVELTDKKAIYVNGCRITHRSTKWGFHTSLEVFSCEAKDVVRECLDRGYGSHVKNIDSSPYLEQRKALSADALKQ